MDGLAALIKQVGRGARLARDLDAEQAEAVMTAIVDGAADAYQIGAFLLAMRMKSESAAELAGFVRALRRACRVEPMGPGPLVDVDLHGDGREGRPSVALAAATIAAACGARVVLRGWFNNRHARNDLGETFALLGVGHGRIEAGVAIIDLEEAAPRVAELMALRERIGVRTCIHSAVKLLDPAGARRQLVGIFHSPYHAPVAGAAHLLGAERVAVVQGPGGLPEISPDKPTRITRIVDGEPPPAMPEATSPRPEHAVPLEPAATPAALAELLEAVIAGHGPPGATRAALLTADLMLWACGLDADPAAALAGGRAQRVLADLRL